MCLAFFRINHNQSFIFTVVINRPILFHKDESSDYFVQAQDKEWSNSLHRIQRRHLYNFSTL